MIEEKRKSIREKIADTQPVKVVRKAASVVRALGDPSFLCGAGVHPDAIRKITGRTPK